VEEFTMLHFAISIELINSKT